jgi:nucleotidyltransferase substrate binding protein (TIGR01987 family)
MEPREIFRSKLNTYKQAVEGFVRSLHIETSNFDEVVRDSIKNGQILKFEYCSELTWKMVKRFLYLFAGLDTNSPKDAIKNLFLSKHIEQKDYEALMEMIDDRNMLSHIYRVEYFDKIYAKLISYSDLMERVISIIEDEDHKEG